MYQETQNRDLKAACTCKQAEHTSMIIYFASEVPLNYHHCDITFCYLVNNTQASYVNG